MGWKTVLSIFFFFIVVILLVVYWFVPFGTIEFISEPKNTNFTLNSTLEEGVQFYENMRYPSPDISYKIENCSLKKEDDMKRAFEIIGNSTILSFYPVGSDEEISVTCDSQTRVEEGLFIAGEGGPTNITRSEEFNVIHHGSVLLIKSSLCEKPNIALHELLHALGFDHSDNPSNIMYAVSRCSQEIGQDIPDLINQLYSFPSQPDLAFENVSASMSRRYLDVTMTIRNNGLNESGTAEIIIYADSKSVKEIELEPMEIGHGQIITLTNIFVMQANVDEIELLINSNFEELKKDNNRVTLEIKK